jgi:hypothetical protein
MSMITRLTKLETLAGVSSSDYLMRWRRHAEELLALSGESVTEAELEAFVSGIQAHGGPCSHEEALLHLEYPEPWQEGESSVAHQQD